MRKSAGRTGASVLRAIEQGRFESVYVLLGDDPVMADEIIGRLRARLLAPGLEPFDYESYQADDLASDTLNPDVVGQHLRQPPVGSARRLVVITGITRDGRRGAKYPARLGKDGVDRLLGHAARTPDTTSVVLTGLPHAPLSRALSGLGLAPAVVDLRQPGPAELAALVRHWAEERGVTIAPDAVHLLLDISGNNTGVLKSEVDKLADCCPAGERVTARRVRELAGSSRGFRLWEYTNRVMERDTGAALGVLRHLEEWGEEPVGIIASLTTGFLNLVWAKAGLLPASDWRVRDHIDRWNNTTEVNRCLQQLYRIDRAYMIGRPEPYARLAAFTHCVACRVKPGHCDLYADGREHELCIVGRPRRKKHA